MSRQTCNWNCFECVHPDCIQSDSAILRHERNPEYEPRQKQVKPHKEKRVTISRKEQRRKAAEAGICVTCMKNKAREGRKKCEACAERDRINGARRRQQYPQIVAAGLCTRCYAKPAREGRRLCEQCAEDYRIYYHKRKAANA